MIGGGGGGFECRWDELVGLVVSFITSPGGAVFCRHYFLVLPPQRSESGYGEWRREFRTEKGGGFSCGDAVMSSLL